MEKKVWEPGNEGSATIWYLLFNCLLGRLGAMHVSDDQFLAIHHSLRSSYTTAPI